MRAASTELTACRDSSNYHDILSHRPFYVSSGNYIKSTEEWTGLLTLSAAEIASKQRHLHLLQKVKANRPLSAAELKELKSYEEMAKKTAKKSVPCTPRRRKTQKQVRKRDVDGKFKNAAGSRINELQIKKLAAELKSLAAMDEQFESHFDGILEKYPRIKKALEQAIAQRVEDVIQQRFASLDQKDYRRDLV